MTAWIRAGLAGLALLAAPAAAIEVRVLESPAGATFWLVEEPSIPTVTIESSFAGGARLDPEGKEGLTYVLGAMLNEGAGELDAVGFAEARDAISARLSFGAGKDQVTIGALMLVEEAGATVDLLALALAEPRFDLEPLERVRAQVLSRIAASAEDPSAVASETWYARAFPDHPYGRPMRGTADSVTRITREDLVTGHPRLLNRANARISVVGAVGPVQAGELVDRILSGLPEGEPLPPGRFPEPPPPGLTVIQMDVPQSAALFGQAGVPHDHPDYYPAYVMNYILAGGGFTTRLMTEVREKRGLAYSAVAYLQNLDEASIYLGHVQTENARIAETLEVIRTEWARMAVAGISADELEAAKRYLTGSFPLSFSTNIQIAQQLVGLQENRLGPDYLDRRNSLIEAVTLADVNRVARRLLDPDALSIVVVGQPEGL